MTGGASNRADEVVLVRAIAAGSEDALGALYDRHADGVFAAALRLSSDRQLAEEVVQETFLALWNRAELYDPAAGSLEAWLFTIARNRTVDRLRAAGRRPRLIALSSAAAPDEPEGVTLERLAASGEVIGGAQVDPGPELALDRVEIQQALRGALAVMGDEERTVILLAYRNGLTQSEIAGRLGWPLGTVKTRTRRALHQLREALAAELGPDLGLDLGPIPAGER